MSGWKRGVLILVLATLIPAQLGGGLEKVSAATPTTEAGLASFYGPGFHGRRTASGIPFDMTRMFAAHPSLPFGTILRVTNLVTRRSVDVTVVDRGPVHRLRRRGVIVDLSQAAAKALGFVHEGRTPVTVRVISKSAELNTARSQ
jgi:rare lipoprotein A